MGRGRGRGATLPAWMTEGVPGGLQKQQQEEVTNGGEGGDRGRRR